MKQSIWAFRCELFVEEAFGTSGQYQSAWQAAQHLSLHREPATRAPAGALMFFAPNSFNDYDGHVGISLGHGRMISALATVEVTNVARSRYWNYDYVGWAQAPRSWPGRIPPPPGSGQPLVSSAVQITAPAFDSIVSGPVTLGSAADNVGGVAYFAYYATNPSKAATIGWHFLGDATDQTGTWVLNWNTTSVPDQGDAAEGTVNVAAVALTTSGAETGTRDYRRFTVDNTNAPVTTTTQSTTATTTTSTTTTPATAYPETTGGVSHTWSDYEDAGGTEGPYIPAYTTVQIACKLTGFEVADGNTWWYRIAGSPWDNQFYASADDFYNNGQTSGSLQGTPLVDPNVPNC